jgi:hypothetical protein
MKGFKDWLGEPFVRGFREVLVERGTNPEALDRLLESAYIRGYGDGRDALLKAAGVALGVDVDAYKEVLK